MNTDSMKKENEFMLGARDAVPIALGYFAVAFSLGIAAHNVGMTAVQGFFLSLLNNASAGEYAGIASIAGGTTLAALAVLILITNARYLLMSCALSQKLDPSMRPVHRLFIAWGVTDELFGLAITRQGYVKPSYLYGAYITALSCWAVGTAAGVAAGNAFPAVVVAALSASIFGMFLAIVLPPARKDKAVFAVVMASFILSSVCSYIPLFQSVSESIRVIILTLIISVCAAVLKPVADEETEDTESAADPAKGRAKGLQAVGKESVA